MYTHRGLTYFGYNSHLGTLFIVSLLTGTRSFLTTVQIKGPDDKPPFVMLFDSQTKNALLAISKGSFGN